MLTVDSQPSLSDHSSSQDPKLFNPRPHSKKMSDADFSHYTSNKIREILRHSKHFKEVQEPGELCKNHPSVEAKYVSLSSGKCGSLCSKCAFLSETINFTDCEAFLSEKERKNKNIINNFYKNFLKNHKVMEGFPSRESFNEELKQLTDGLLSGINALKEEFIQSIESCFEKMHDKVQIMGVEKHYEYEQYKKHFAERRNKISNFVCEIEKNYAGYIFSSDGSLVDPKISQYSRQLAIMGKNPVLNVLEFKPNLKKMVVRREVVREFENTLMRIINKAVRTTNDLPSADYQTVRLLSKGRNNTNSQLMAFGNDKRQPSQIFPETEEIVFFELQEPQSISLYEFRPKDSITSEDWQSRVLVEEQSCHRHNPNQLSSSSYSEATLSNILKLTNERNGPDDPTGTTDGRIPGRSSEPKGDPEELVQRNSTSVHHDSDSVHSKSKSLPAHDKFSKRTVLPSIDCAFEENGRKNFFKKPNAADKYEEQSDQHSKGTAKKTEPPQTLDQPTSRANPSSNASPSVKKVANSPPKVQQQSTSKFEFKELKGNFRRATLALKQSTSEGPGRKWLFKGAVKRTVFTRPKDNGLLWTDHGRKPTFTRRVFMKQPDKQSQAEADRHTQSQTPQTADQVLQKSLKTDGDNQVLPLSDLKDNVYSFTEKRERAVWAKADFSKTKGGCSTKQLPFLRKSQTLTKQLVFWKDLAKRNLLEKQKTAKAGTGGANNATVTKHKSVNNLTGRVLAIFERGNSNQSARKAIRPEKHFEVG